MLKDANRFRFYEGSKKFILDLNVENVKMMMDSTVSVISQA